VFAGFGGESRGVWNEGGFYRKRQLIAAAETQAVLLAKRKDLGSLGLGRRRLGRRRKSRAVFKGVSLVGAAEAGGLLFFFGGGGTHLELRKSGSEALKRGKDSGRNKISPAAR